MAVVSPDTGTMEQAEEAAGAGMAARAAPAARAHFAAQVRRAGRSSPSGLAAVLRRPLTSYYLILGITTLLLALGLVMVLCT